MAFISENSMPGDDAVHRLDAITALTKLLLNELESMRKSSSIINRLPTSADRNLNEQVQRYEVTLICRALIESHGNQARAAKRLGMKSNTLHAKIRRYKIDALGLFSESSSEAAQIVIQ